MTIMGQHRLTNTRSSSVIALPFPSVGIKAMRNPSYDSIGCLCFLCLLVVVFVNGPFVSLSLLLVHLSHVVAYPSLLCAIYMVPVSTMNDLSSFHRFTGFDNILNKAPHVAYIYPGLNKKKTPRVVNALGDMTEKQ